MSMELAEDKDERSEPARSSALLNIILESRYYISRDRGETWHTLRTVEWPQECECGLIIGLTGIPGDPEAQMAYGRGAPGRLCAGCAKKTGEGLETQTGMVGL